MATRVAVVGASGKMGTLASRLIERSDDFELGPQLGSGDALDAVADADLVLDFTKPAVSPDVVAAALEHGRSILVGTSGWTAERLAGVESKLRAYPELGVVVVPNFSLGSVLATRFSALAAPYFDSIEIVEAHHAGKIDSPSGTAIRTAELIAEARSASGPVAAPHADQRARGQQVASVPVHSIRVTGVIAQQEVLFGGVGETLSIRHVTTSDSSYEAGILLGLRAARDATGLIVGLDAILEAGGES